MSPPPYSKFETSTAETSIRHEVRRPGWPEIIFGFVAWAIVGLGGGSQMARLGLDPVVYGLIFTALSGVAGLAGFAAAALLRKRSWSSFGVCRVSGRWLLLGVAAGVGAFVLKGIAILAYIRITGDSANPQGVYALGAGGGMLSLFLATMFLGVLTPLGEEFLFRGVVTNALLRYGPFIGVAGSALIFALLHGINIVLPAALVLGVIAAELFRRSGSVWPGVVVHVVFNLPTIPIMVLASAK